MEKQWCNLWKGGYFGGIYSPEYSGSRTEAVFDKEPELLRGDTTSFLRHAVDPRGFRSSLSRGHSVHPNSIMSRRSKAPLGDRENAPSSTSGSISLSSGACGLDQGWQGWHRPTIMPFEDGERKLKAFQRSR